MPTFTPVILLAAAGALCLALAAAAARQPLDRGRWAWAGLLVVAAGLFFAAGSRTYRRLKRARSALSHYYAGLDQLQRGDLKAAEAEFQRSLSLQPGLPQAKEDLRKVAQQPVAPKRQESVKLHPAAAPTRGTTPGQKTEPVHPPHVPSPFEITRYDLAVPLHPDQHTLSAVATLNVRSRKERLTSLLFALSPDFTVDRALQDGQPLVLRQINDRLTLE